MIRIAKLTNETRAAQRPPLQDAAASFAILAELRRFAPKKVVHKKPVKGKRAEPGQVKPASPTALPLKSPAEQPPIENAEEKKPVPPPSTTRVNFTPPLSKPPATNGSSTNGAGTNGTNRPNGTNGTHGTNGFASRSDIFRSSAFTSTPSVRIPPRPAAPSQNSSEKPPPARTENSASTPAVPENSGGSGQNGRSQASSYPARPVQPAAPASRKFVPRLEDFLNRNPELPSQTAILGICDDSLPILLDLHDPAPGAILAVGGEREEQLGLLRTAVASMAVRNSPRAVQFLVLTCDPQPWQEWIVEQGIERHSLGIESAEDESVREWVLRLADWTEQRRLGQRSGPPVLVIMDTLSFLPRLSYDVRLNFEWMAKEGPQAEVWPIAAVSTELARVLQARRMLRAFQTRILGCTEDPAVYTQLFGLTEQAAAGFKEPGQFSVQVGENWLKFRLFRSK